MNIFLFFYYYVLHSINIFTYLCNEILLVLAYSMKSIVVYIIAFLLWFLTIPNGLMAQKPAIDLISSHHQYRHPEAIIDTGYAVNPPLREAVLYQPDPEQNKELAREPDKKKRRQIGPSLDSLFQKEETSKPEKGNPGVKISYYHKRLNPLKFILYITALK